MILGADRGTGWNLTVVEMKMHGSTRPTVVVGLSKVNEYTRVRLVDCCRDEKARIKSICGDSKGASGKVNGIHGFISPSTCRSCSRKR